MRVLILGGSGMLGHRLLRHFSTGHEARVTLRRNLSYYSRFRLFGRGNSYDGVEAADFERVSAVLADFKPQAVINAIGIVKQRPEANEHIVSIKVNALFPHRLAGLCRAHGAQLVHLSTDCVFSGEKGNYAEFDRTDPVDLYGLTKLLGEVDAPGTLTLRTSTIGLELENKRGLVEWFLAQKGKAIKGYRQAIFSGITTAELARVLEMLITAHPAAHGIYHVSDAPISKLNLLMGIERRLRLRTIITPDDELKCDRSLDSKRFRAAFGYTPHGWDAMLDELAAEIVKGTG